MISSSQNFEDVLLERLFLDKKRGFYVDVGAWDPNQYSVTRHFYRKGWRGVNVEPIAIRHQLFVEQRPRDINLHRLIGACIGPRRFIECVDADYLSTTVESVAHHLKQAGHEVSEYEVEMETLDNIFDRYCPKTVDFLKIDTEGSEAEVLATLDFSRHRPRALVIESTIPESGLKSWEEPEAFGTWTEWEGKVLAADYVFAHYDGLNRFYLRREDSRLAVRLALPPGIFDGIDCSDNWQSRAVERLEVIDQQQGEIASLREKFEAALASLRQAIDVGEADRAARDETIASLRERLSAAEHDRAVKLTLVEQLTAERNESDTAFADAERSATVRIEEIDADRAARGKVIDGLVEQLAAAEADREARLVLIERLATQLDVCHRAQAGAEQAAAARIEAIIKADRVAHGEVIDELVERFTAVEHDRAARRERIEQLSAELDDSRKALADADRTATERAAAVETDNIAQVAAIDGLERQLLELERDCAAKRELIERLTVERNEDRAAHREADRAATARIAAIEVDRVERGEVINGLANQLAAVEADRAARLDLIERFARELDDGRQTFAAAEQAGAARIAAIEADHAARGEMIARLTERLEAADERLAELRLWGDRLEATRRDGEARNTELEQAIRTRDVDAATMRHTDRDLRAQLAAQEGLTRQQTAIADSQRGDIDRLAEQLTSASAEIVHLRRPWSTKFLSLITGRS